MGNLTGQNQTATLLAANGGAPLTLVATSNGIGGITLTTLGSLHQQHQQQQQQQQQFQQQQQQLQQQQAVVAALGLAPNSFGNIANLGGTILTLNGQPILIQQQPQQPQPQQANIVQANLGQLNQIQLGNPQQIIYQQQPTAMLQPMQIATNQKQPTANIVLNTNGTSFSLSNQDLQNALSQHIVLTGSAANGGNITLGLNQQQCQPQQIQLQQQLNGGIIQAQVNPNGLCAAQINPQNANNNNNGGNSFNAVAVAAAAELVNSLLVKSEQTSVGHMAHGEAVINFADLAADSSLNHLQNDLNHHHHHNNNSSNSTSGVVNGNGFTNTNNAHNSNNSNNQQQLQLHQENERINDEEKDNKSESQF